MKYEADLKDDEARIVYGLKGMKSKPFAKKFKNATAMDKWLDSDAAGDVTVTSIERAR